MLRAEAWIKCSEPTYYLLGLWGVKGVNNVRGRGRTKHDVFTTSRTCPSSLSLSLSLPLSSSLSPSFFISLFNSFSKYFNIFGHYGHTYMEFEQAPSLHWGGESLIILAEVSFMTKYRDLGCLHKARHQSKLNDT